MNILKEQTQELITNLEKLHGDYKILHGDMVRQHEEHMEMANQVRILVRNMKILETLTAIGLLLIIFKFFIS